MERKAQEERRGLFFFARKIRLEERNSNLSVFYGVIDTGTGNHLGNRKKTKQKTRRQNTKQITKIRCRNRKKIESLFLCVNFFLIDNTKHETVDMFFSINGTVFHSHWCKENRMFLQPSHRIKETLPRASIKMSFGRGFRFRRSRQSDNQVQ